MKPNTVPDISQIPEEYFRKLQEQIRVQERTQKALTPEQEQRMEEGFAVEEMTKMPGWQVVANLLQTMAFHSWVDPRTVEAGVGSSKDEWLWRELNAFYMANNAKELLETVNSYISEAHQLHSQKLGETRGPEKMRI
jgi:hypothetical protein